MSEENCKPDLGILWQEFARSCPRWLYSEEDFNRMQNYLAIESVLVDLQGGEKL